MKHERGKFLLFFGDVILFYLSLFLTLLMEYRGFPTSPSLGDFFLYSSWLFVIWLFLLFIFDFYSFKLKTGSFSFYRYFFIFVFLSIFSGILYFYLQPELIISPKTLRATQRAGFRQQWQEAVDLPAARRRREAGPAHRARRR